MIEGLFVASFAELVVGGGGRVFALGPLTLRMLFFALALVVWALAVLARPGRRDGQILALTLVYAFLVTHMPAFIVDAREGYGLTASLGGVQVVLYWLAAPFFALALRDQAMIWTAARMVMLGGSIVAAASLGIAAAILAGLVNYDVFYAWANKSQEVIVRVNVLFFYKGVSYAALAILFLVALRPRFWLLFCLLGVGVLLQSLTRGLILATLLTLIPMMVVTRQWRSLAVLGLMCLALFVVFFDQIWLAFFDESRASSFSTRVNDTAEFSRNFDWQMLIGGHGFGTLLNNRANVENTFMWAMWRLGLGGLLFWFSPFFICLFFYLRIPRRDPRHDLASAWFFGVVLIYLQTMSNPLLNNSIGLSFLMVALFSLRTIGNQPFDPAARDYRFLPRLRRRKGARTRVGARRPGEPITP